MIRALLERLRREDGFTLTELVVVMPMLAVVLAAITGTMVTLMNGDSKTTEQLTQQATVRPTLDAMMRDLRSTMPPSIGGAGVLSATSTAITFYSPDAVFATSGPTSAFHLRELAYRFSGGGLQRQAVISTNTYTAVTSTIPWGNWTSAAGTFPLAAFPAATAWSTLLGAGLTASGSSPPLVASTFTYYDGDGNLIAAPVSAANIGLIRTIQVNVTATSGGHDAKQTAYSNTATIRETQPPQ